MYTQADDGGGGSCVVAAGFPVVFRALQVIHQARHLEQQVPLVVVSVREQRMYVERAIFTLIFFFFLPVAPAAGRHAPLFSFLSLACVCVYMDIVPSSSLTSYHFLLELLFPDRGVVVVRLFTWTCGRKRPGHPERTVAPAQRFLLFLLFLRLWSLLAFCCSERVTIRRRRIPHYDDDDDDDAVYFLLSFFFTRSLERNKLSTAECNCHQVL